MLVLLASPLFIRLAWPTRSLPDGPLRRRLERVAERVGFRFNDLLVWDTRHMMVNACVTGVLPGFRYVLLTDALIESLSPVEVAAVFGHEVGHVAHRHLPFFGFFFLGSLGILALAARVFSVSETWIKTLTWIPADFLAPAGDFIEAAAMLGCLGVFFCFVFGHLSRRFERQADVFGCKVVSCGLAECPPHVDPEQDSLEPAPGHSGVSSICPVGIESSLGRSRASPSTTASTARHDPGDMAASRLDSRSSSNFRPIPPANRAFNAVSGPIGSCSRHSWWPRS